jgi:hypothetical protein
MSKASKPKAAHAAKKRKSAAAAAADETKLKRSPQDQLVADMEGVFDFGQSSDTSAAPLALTAHDLLAARVVALEARVRDLEQSRTLLKEEYTPGMVVRVVWPSNVRDHDKIGVVSRPSINPADGWVGVKFPCTPGQITMLYPHHLRVVPEPWSKPVQKLYSSFCDSCLSDLGL